MSTFTPISPSSLFLIAFVFKAENKEQSEVEMAQGEFRPELGRETGRRAWQRRCVKGGRGKLPSFLVHSPLSLSHPMPTCSMIKGIPHRTYPSQQNYARVLLLYFGVVQMREQQRRGRERTEERYARSQSKRWLQMGKEWEDLQRQRCQGEGCPPGSCCLREWIP